MSDSHEKLFEAFRQDHAILGRGYFDLSSCLRRGDAECARDVADRLNHEAGAHIAFEEEDFYPRLRPILGSAVVDGMRADHRRGYEIVRAILERPRDAGLAPEEAKELLRGSETMERHIAECGDLFGAMAELSAATQDRLYVQLVAWSDERPTWSEYVARRGGSDGRT